MLPIGSKFRCDSVVNRADLALALVVGARVPQYLPGLPTYQDVRDNNTMLFVESVQAITNGLAIFGCDCGGPISSE